MAAEKKNMGALKNIGDYYFNGIVVEKDIKMAIKYYHFVYENGNPYSAAILGDIYSDKNDEELKEFYDLTKAIKYYKFAVDFGLTDSLSDLCLALASDVNILCKNRADFEKYLELGEQIRDRETMCLYGCLLLDGAKMYHQEAKGLSLLKECAQMGDTFAMKELAEIYEKGHGPTRPNHEEAQKYRAMLENEKKAVESKCCLLI